jgi:hypothetical protein
MAKDRHRNRGGHNFIDLTGERFGKLVVIKDTGRRKSRRPIWECLCDCGTTFEALAKYIRNGDTKSCGCYNRGNAHNRDAVGEITKSFWTPIVKQAIRRGIPFEVTREEAWSLYQSQDGRCALTGVPIRFSTNIRDQRGTQTASLDRIVNSLAYTPSNVQWVHKKVNIMKNVMSNAELVEWCGLVQRWMQEHSDLARPSVGRGLPVVHVPCNAS